MPTYICIHTHFKWIHMHAHIHGNHMSTKTHECTNTNVHPFVFVGIHVLIGWLRKLILLNPHQLHTCTSRSIYLTINLIRESMENQNMKNQLDWRAGSKYYNIERDMAYTYLTWRFVSVLWVYIIHNQEYEFPDFKSYFSLGMSSTVQFRKCLKPDTAFHLLFNSPDKKITVLQC